MKNLFLASIWLLVINGQVFAEADGPDFYGARDQADGRPLIMRATPQFGATPLQVIPAGARCLQNLGCQGGLSLAAFSRLAKTAQAARAADNPRWCNVAWQGASGWVEGRFLVEAPCPEKASAQP